MQITMYTRNLTNNHLIWSTNFNCFIFRCIYYAVVLEWRTWMWQFFPFFPRSSFISLLAFWRTGTTPLAVAFEDESFYSIEFTKTCKLIEHFLSYVYAIPMFQYVSRLGNRSSFFEDFLIPKGIHAYEVVVNLQVSNNILP